MYLSNYLVLDVILDFNKIIIKFKFVYFVSYR